MKSQRQTAKALPWFGPEFTPPNWPANWASAELLQASGQRFQSPALMMLPRLSGYRESIYCRRFSPQSPNSHRASARTAMRIRGGLLPRSPPSPFKGSVLDRDVKRIDELKMVCAELYQVIGALSGAHHDCFAHPDVQRALDNASAGRLVHKDLLPFPQRTLYGQKRPKLKRSGQSTNRNTQP